MAKKTARRTVRLQQFREQVTEAVLPPDGRVEIEVADGVSVSIRIPLTISQEPDDELRDYLDKIKAAENEHDLAEVILTSDDLKKWRDAGATDAELAHVFSAETQGARERLGKFRYNRSGN